MKHIKKLSGIILLTMMVSASVYAKGNGQVDFADLSSHYGEPMVEVNLTANLMHMIGSFAKSEEPEVAKMLANLDYVKVRIYSLNGKADEANNTIEGLSKKLKADNWETLVTVNDYEEDKNVRIFSKSSDDIIDGFVVMVVSPEKDGGEAIFVNIVGSIDPSQIAMITENLDINFN
ncbi:MAG: DUF4252 domain-containing protein [Arenicella sp.]|jgi:hypothetical protein|nr:DUF4252 domain-containing protein [Arenicella sp.]